MAVVARRIPDLNCPIEAGSVYVVAVSILARERPVRIHPYGAILYHGLNTPVIRRQPPRFGQPGESLKFVRCRGHSGCPGGRLVVHESLRPAIERVATVDFAPAECVGVLDVDPTDWQLMNQLSEKFPSIPNPEDLLRSLGGSVVEREWLEIVAPHWDGLPEIDESPVEFNLEPTARADCNGLGVMWGLFPDQPLGWRTLKNHGMVVGRAVTMSLSVAKLLTPLMPSEFWWSSYWTIEES